LDFQFARKYSLKAGFSLDDYVQNELILWNSTAMARQANSLDVNFINKQDFVKTTATLQSNVNFIVLVDFADRTIEDIDYMVKSKVEGTEDNLSFLLFWEVFVRKIQNSASIVSLDKFLYVHDVGRYHINKVFCLLLFLCGVGSR